MNVAAHRISSLNADACSRNKGKSEGYGRDVKEKNLWVNGRERNVGGIILGDKRGYNWEGNSY